MSKGVIVMGGTLGTLVGLFVGMFIPTGEEIAISFLGRITGEKILADHSGFFISGVYVLLAIAVCGAIGGVIGSLFDK